MSRVRDMNTLIGMLDRGEVVREASKSLGEVLQTLYDRSADSPKKKLKGKVTLTVDIEVLNGVATIAGKVVAKAPEPERGTSLFWLTADGELTVEHPQQHDMFRPLEAVNQ